MPVAISAMIITPSATVSLDTQETGVYQQVLEYYKQALNIAKEVGEQTGKLIAYGNLCNDYHILGDYRQAFAYHKQTLKSVTGPEKELPIAISALFITSSVTTNKH